MSERPEIPIMIRLAGEGRTTREIADELNQDGMPQPIYGGKWTASHVSTALHNRKVPFRRVGDGEVPRVSRTRFAWDFSDENISTGGYG